MSIQSMLGVFILLAISVVGGLFIMIMEWIYTIAKRNRKGKKVRIKGVSLWNCDVGYR